MFQTFAVTSTPEQGPARLAALRDEMKEEGVAAFLVPRADAHQGEYVAPADERLAWLTGFTGSAGFCAVLAEEAGLFVDGRYRVQVRSQADPVFSPVNWPETQLADWLKERLPRGATVAFDPWLHTVEEIDRLRAALRPAGIVVTESPNLVDRVWDDRPAPPSGAFTAYPDDLAGRSAADKRRSVAAELKEAQQRAAILTLPDSIAWLLNIRGTDTVRNPVPHAFAIVMDDGTCQLFAGHGKADAVADHLGPDVAVLPEDGLLAAVASLDGPTRIDPKSCPVAVAEALTAAEVEIAHGDDPCRLPKARKTGAELDGARAAQQRDAVAMVNFLAWLDEEAPKGELTEIAVVEALEGFRRATNALLDISFETICGSGPHGAIVHYRVTEASDRAVSPGELLLVDSGGQYIDGTTDITRTVTIGDAPAGAAEAYTLVLKGMVAISRARFPKGVAGAHLDVLARYALWLDGKDYDHGTGHGVGAYLSVHEGPQGLSRRSNVPLEPGMILSNEPGYYREGAWGIRIENLIVVEDAPPLPEQDDRPWLAFETLTYVPFDRRLILPDLLTGPERDWINAYHADTLSRIGPRLDAGPRAWLEAACAPI
ncbi:aminopeptidase P family protein [Wenxinia marina]|uniref:Xaa-Pro aminopeptidase n=1 Tax=Wenxinia marina DSM 24838 TaxID=1123501 RepID=A0A0D0Q821_9RHOB|nr:aminopeptidase P family protein [Wenxinia marina]KIQ68577.1 Xaa-Pro aminopeptidase [Wenxinia marina DSM 24838]GGL67001.1 Xaa-Pro aminopeptidase [Wenxinia marina]